MPALGFFSPVRAAGGNAADCTGFDEVVGDGPVLAAVFVFAEGATVAEVAPLFESTIGFLAEAAITVLAGVCV